MNRIAATVRPALAGLTTRGRSFLAAGCAAAACAVLLGQTDLFRVAVLLAALPLVAGLALARTRYRLALTRIVAPSRVVAGSTARIRLELDNISSVGTRVLLAEESVPYSLGTPPRFVVDRLGGGRRIAVSYALRSEVRGRYEVGPLSLRLTDPFGMCELVRSFTATDELVVLPRTHPLGPASGGGAWAGGGDSGARAAAASGEDDVATREYRHGDDLRRVHWRSTAHRGELMVRTDEQPRQMRATVLLDRRAQAHRGEGPASSFEWAVSAAASVGLHLARRRFSMRIVMDAEVPAWSSREPSDAAALLDTLAVVQPGRTDTLAAATAALARSGGDGLLVAVLGEVDEQDAMALARLHRSGVRPAAILLRTTAWTAMPQRRAMDVDARRARALEILRAAGWTATETGPEETISQAWSRLGRALSGQPGGRTLGVVPGDPARTA